MGDHSVQVYVNPLIYFGSEFRPEGLTEGDASYASMMGFICAPGTDSQVPALIARYNEISVEKNRLPAAPSEPTILDRLIWPLRHAKGSYVVGNYLGAIALCGLVSEMAAILTFDMYNEAQDPPRYDRTGQVKLFGSAFEKLGQERRVAVLESLKLVTPATAAAFDGIRQRRRKYLHLWSEGHNKIAEDAVQCFDAAVTVVVATLGMSFHEGKLQLKDDVFTYLNKHDVATPWIPPTEFLNATDQLDPRDPEDEIL